MATLSNKNIALGSTSWTLNSIRRMWRELNAIVAEQGEIELANWVQLPEQTPEQFEANKERARREVFRILGTVEFDNDDAIHEFDPEIVNVEDDGPRIRYVYLSNIRPYEIAFGAKPDHAFEVRLDLSSPSLFDANSVLSAPTPNNTSLAITGSRSGWKAGVEAVVRSNIPRRRPIRTWFHGAMIYDLFLFCGAIPFALYACWVLEPQVDAILGATSPVVVGAAYLYIGFTVLWGYRFMFSYAKWAFPFTEITDQKSSPARHRAIWWTLMGIVLFRPFSSLVSELWKRAFGV